jgi:hypothetical protein
MRCGRSPVGNSDYIASEGDANVAANIGIANQRDMADLIFLNISIY